jgi:hypothetical protein
MILGLIAQPRATSISLRNTDTGVNCNLVVLGAEIKQFLSFHLLSLKYQPMIDGQKRKFVLA